VPCGIFSPLPQCVGVKASFSLGRDDIGLRQSKITAETLRENVIVRQSAGANTAILAGNCAPLDTGETENDLELNKEEDE